RGSSRPGRKDGPPLVLGGKTAVSWEGAPPPAPSDWSPASPVIAGAANALRLAVAAPVANAQSAGRTPPFPCRFPRRIWRRPGAGAFRATGPGWAHHPNTVARAIQSLTPAPGVAASAANQGIVR